MTRFWKTPIVAAVLTLGSATAWAGGGMQPQPQPTPGRPDPRPPAPVTVSLRITPPTVKIDNPVTVDVTVAGGPPLVAGGARLHPVYTLTATKVATDPRAPAGSTAAGGRTVVATRARTEPLRWTPNEAGTYNLQLVLEWADGSGHVVPGSTTVARHDRYVVTK